jgi:hypothetical protein
MLSSPILDGYILQKCASGYKRRHSGRERGNCESSYTFAGNSSGRSRWRVNQSAGHSFGSYVQQIIVRSSLRRILCRAIRLSCAIAMSGG